MVFVSSIPDLSKEIACEHHSDTIENSLAQERKASLAKHDALDHLDFVYEPLDDPIGIAFCQPGANSRVVAHDALRKALYFGELTLVRFGEPLI